MYGADSGGTVEIFMEGINLDQAGARDAFVAGGVAEKTKVAFDDLVEVVKQAADAAADKFASLAKKPSEISLEFGLTIGVEGGVPVFAKMTGEGSVKVGLVWRDN